MNIALNTDFSTDAGIPEPYLKLMAEAGFTHVHWCHQWATDFIYTDSEIRQYHQWLKQYGLTLLDIHGSAGKEKCWFSTVEFQRQAGVELVANRMRMLRECEGTGTVMMHIPSISVQTPAEEIDGIRLRLAALKKSLDELMPLSRELHVPLALENMPGDTFAIMDELFDAYPADFIGLCFDSGHGHMQDDHGLDNLDRHKDRLLALHIHDNDGKGDLHQPPFYGTLDWDRFADILKRSPYPREISFELSKNNTPFKEDLNAFIHDAYQRCLNFTQMVRG